MNLPRHTFWLLLSLIASAAGAETTIVTLDHFAFQPKRLTVTPGTTVTWINEDDFSHTVIAEGKESARLRNGSSFSHTFANPGEYEVQCGVHNGMSSRVIVTAAATRAAASTITPTPAQTAPPASAKPATMPPPASAETTDRNTVAINSSMQFEPALVTVKAGQAVTWVNEDGSNHVLKFADVSSPRLRKGASYTRSFNEPGEYPYDCAIHGARMSGKIIVVAP